MSDMQKTSRLGKLSSALGTTLLISALLLLSWVWFFWRIQVPLGQTMVVTRELGTTNPNSNEYRVIPSGLLDKGYKGIQEQVYGEGYYFLNPIWFKTSTAQKIQTLLPEGGRVPGAPRRGIFRRSRPAKIAATQPVNKYGPQLEQVPIGVVTSQSGKALAGSSFLTNKAYVKGVKQQVLTPGSWRFNPHSHKIVIAKATVIPPGYVGVVTNQAGPSTQNPDNLADEGQKGVLRKVLMPGIYYLNPKAQRVNVIEIGYRQLSLKGRNQIRFPSKDGYSIACDITVVWGIHPNNAPYIVQNIGPSDTDVIKKVINQSVQSASRNEGSQFSAAELVTGTMRKEFVDRFTATLVKECKAHKLDILIGLIRDITIPSDIRKPIQEVQIHNERQQTIAQEELTQKERNKLETVKGDVLKKVTVTRAITARKVAEDKQSGLKLVAETRAKGRAEIAKIMLEVATLEAQIAEMKGKGEAKVTQLRKEAEADRFTQVVKAFGTSEAYTRYMFAQSLPSNFTVVLRYAGEGTFWTDLPKEFKGLERAASMKILKRK